MTKRHGDHKHIYVFRDGGRGEGVPKIVGIWFPGSKLSATLCIAMHCSTVQCSVVQCIFVQYSAVQCSAVQLSAVQCSAVQCTLVEEKGERLTQFRVAEKGDFDRNR